MNITPGLIRKLSYPTMPAVLVQAWADKLGAACTKGGIDTPQRLAHFLSQISHESGGLQWLEELWGPTPAQIRYEGRLDLGNTQAGDGYLFRGRSPLQLTGRANYRATGQHIGQPLETQPELASQIGVGSQIAVDYWVTHHLNALADQGGLKMVAPITQRINGGQNGIADRLRRYSIAAHVLGL